MRTFLDNHFIIIPTQYGFGPMHSTSHTMLDLLTSAYDKINQNKYTALLLLDLEKTFHSVNHRILFSKILHYGFRGAVKNLSFFVKKSASIRILK